MLHSDNFHQIIAVLLRKFSIISCKKLGRGDAIEPAWYKGYIFFMRFKHNSAYALQREPKFHVIMRTKIDVVLIPST